VVFQGFIKLSIFRCKPTELTITLRSDTLSIMENHETNVEQDGSSKLAAADTRVVEDPTTDGTVETSNEKSEGETYQQESFLEGNILHVTLPFPWKVHEMLGKVEKDGQDDIVSWLPHGNAFQVHKEKQFLDTIMPSYFKQSKFTSFTRQLYIYGFQKIQDGPDKGAFVHKNFVKNNKFLCLAMPRKKDKPLRKPLGLVRSPNSLPQSPLVPIGVHCYPQYPIGGNATPLFSDVVQRSVSQAGTDQVTQGFLPTSFFTSSPTASGPVAPLQPSAPLPAFSEIDFAKLEGSWEQHPQPEEEREDWLSKYERPSARPMLSIEKEPTRLSQQEFSPGINPLGWDNLDKVLLLLGTINQASSINMAWQHDSQYTNMLVRFAEPSVSHGADERIRPRFTNPSYDIEKQRYRCSKARPNKESDLFRDGDEVDFEGKTFHFVEG
jgi:HSF-type DNA-binding